MAVVEVVPFLRADSPEQSHAGCILSMLSLLLIYGPAHLAGRTKDSTRNTYLIQLKLIVYVDCFFVFLVNGIDLRRPFIPYFVMPREIFRLSSVG